MIAATTEGITGGEQILLQQPMVTNIPGMPPRPPTLGGMRLFVTVVLFDLVVGSGGGLANDGPLVCLRYCQF